MSRKVLIADDDKEVFLFLKRIIKNKFNKDCLWAENGLKAIQLLESEDIEAVIMDFNMPVMDGIEALNLIRKNSHFADLPIIMCSSASDSHIVKSVLSYNISDYLLKPLNYEESIRRLSKVLAKKNTDDNNSDTPKLKLLYASGADETFKLLIEQIKDNFEILAAYSGSDAYSLFLNKKPSLVLIGDNLGLLDSEALADKIKQTLMNENEEYDCKVIYFGKNDELSSNNFDMIFNVASGADEILKYINQTSV
jgi:YesN/AraC family two-component response regulator